MPSSFQHDPELTVPASPTANTVAIWSAANNIGATDIVSVSPLHITLSSTPANGTYSGVAASFTAGEALEIGEVVYYKAADDRVWKAVGKVGGTGLISAATPAIGVVAADQGSAGSPVTVLLQGFIRADTNFPTWTKGGTIYVPEDETSSKNVPEQAAPDTDGDFVQILGWAVDANTIYVNPDFTIIEVA